MPGLRAEVVAEPVAPVVRLEAVLAAQVELVVELLLELVVAEVEERRELELQVPQRVAASVEDPADQLLLPPQPQKRSPTVFIALPEDMSRWLWNFVTTS